VHDREGELSLGTQTAGRRARRTAVNDGLEEAPESQTRCERAEGSMLSESLGKSTGDGGGKGGNRAAVAVREQKGVGSIQEAPESQRVCERAQGSMLSESLWKSTEATAGRSVTVAVLDRGVGREGVCEASFTKGGIREAPESRTRCERAQGSTLSESLRKLTADEGKKEVAIWERGWELEKEDAFEEACDECSTA